MRISSLLIAATLLLAACDSSSPDADVPLVEATANTFEARAVTASSERALEGSASPDLGDRSGLFGSFAIGRGGDTTAILTTIELTTNDEAETLVFIGITDAIPVVGQKYAIGFTRGGDQAADESTLGFSGANTFISVYVTQSQAQSLLALGGDGSITFTEATDDVRVGSFRFQARTLVISADGARSAEPTTFEGTFRTDRRVTPDRDGSR